MELIDSGQKSVVKKCIHKRTGEIRALKLIRKNHKSKEDTRLLFKEVNIIRNLDHPNIIRFFEFYEDEQFFYFIMEYVDGKELFLYMIDNRKISERHLAVITQQISRAVHYCH